MSSGKLLGPRTISAKLTATSREELITWKGMAHFAGTGPRGRTCRECLSWDWRAERRLANGHLKEARCKKFSENSQGKKGRKVPDNAEACRHFEFNSDAPKRFE
jgi:hypothetical protein